MASTRPRLHFAPVRNWMNDPNGLVYHDGRYHLYFQHNPHGPSWGNMSWGHASSADLLTWEEHPIALMHDEDEAIFSGSIVYDTANDSALGSVEAPPLVAFYTSAKEDNQSQAIASSADGGITWQKHGVIIDRGTSDFRDPKVFRHGDHWILIAVEAVERQVHFYRSEDLREWTHLSAFGPAGAPEGIWECPDLFFIDGSWVLTLSINPGHPSGGSGMQYFVGTFDGSAFTESSWGWLDWGHDYYAGVTFCGLDEIIMLGWLNNWTYAAETPTEPWRGMAGLPRRLSIRDGVLIQEPAVRLLQLPDHIVRELRVAPEPLLLPSHAHGESMRVRAWVHRDQEITISVRSASDASSGTHIRYSPGRLSVDRSASGDMTFARALEPVSSAPIADGAGLIDLDVWIDASSVEVFADAGTVTISEQIFPSSHQVAVWVSGDHGASIDRLEVTVLDGLRSANGGGAQ